MRVRVLAFAQLKDVLGVSSDVDLPAGATLGDLWSELCSGHAALTQFAGSTQLARNGSLASKEAQLCDGDEIALLPPVGGG